MTPKINKDILALEATSIASILWGVESLFEGSVPFVAADGTRLRDNDAALACITAARKLVEKLADDIDMLGR